MENIREKLQGLNGFDIDIQEIEENKTFDYMFFNDWGLGMTREEYQKKEEEISKTFFENEKYRIDFNYDVSGYNYWIVKKEESNYIIGVLEIKDPSITEQELIEADEKMWELFINLK